MVEINSRSAHFFSTKSHISDIHSNTVWSGPTVAGSSHFLGSDATALAFSEHQDCFFMPSSGEKRRI